MVRALRLFALTTALFVIAVRCLGGSSFALTCAALRADVEAVRWWPASEPSVDQDPLVIVAVDDDTDEDLNPFLAPSALELGLHSPAEVSGLACGAIADQGPLPGHALSLERPPRA